MNRNGMNAMRLCSMSRVFALVMTGSAMLSARAAQGIVPLPQLAALQKAVGVPQEKPFQGTIKIRVDATDVTHRLGEVHESIAVTQPGNSTLLFPQWTPEDHASNGLVMKLPLRLMLVGSNVSPRANLVEAASELDGERLTAIAENRNNARLRSVATGILKSWQGDTQESAFLLEASRRHRALRRGLVGSLLLRYLAYDAADLGQYAKAAYFGSKLLARHDSTLAGNDASDFSSSVELWRILRFEKPMTVRNAANVSLPLLTNSAGRIEATVMIGDLPVHALFDTGAETSSISQSVLTRTKARLLSEKAHDTGSTGASLVTPVAVLDQVSIGESVLQNVPVLVESDAALTLGTPGRETKLDMIIGFPSMAALGSMTLGFDSDVHFGIRLSPVATCAPLIRVGQNVMVSGSVEGKHIDMLLDTGADTSILTSNFMRTYPRLIQGLRQSVRTYRGVGGQATVNQLVLPSLLIFFGLEKIELNRVTVMTRPSPLDSSDSLGILGRDLWRNRTVAIDFKRMQLLLQPPSPSPNDR